MHNSKIQYLENQDPHLQLTFAYSEMSSELKNSPHEIYETVYWIFRKYTYINPESYYVGGLYYYMEMDSKTTKMDFLCPDYCQEISSSTLRRQIYHPNYPVDGSPGAICVLQTTCLLKKNMYEKI